jgi:predicted kinase
VAANRLILLSGLPGTGKSTIALALSRALGLPLFEKDRIEAAIVGAGLAKVQPGLANLGPAGYDLYFALLERQLELGVSLIADCTAPSQRSRDTLAAMCTQHGAHFQPLLCVCSDPALHRSRIESRVRGIPGWHEIAWTDVERSRAGFEPWRDAIPMLDSVDPFDVNIGLALAYVKSGVRALLAALDAGGRVRDLRDIDGHKRFTLQTNDSPIGEIEADDVRVLVDAGLIGSNQKFPGATYWLTDAGRAWLARGWARPLSG